MKMLFSGIAVFYPRFHCRRPQRSRTALIARSMNCKNQVRATGPDTIGSWPGARFAQRKQPLGAGERFLKLSPCHRHSTGPGPDNAAQPFPRRRP
jgi:hypothetical protein